MNQRYIHYGCGHEAPPEWRNFDASPTIILERLPLVGRFLNKNANRFPRHVERGNIVRGLPVPDGSATAVYCSHVLEHLALDEFRQALRNTRRMLVPGGVFRFVLPDLAYSIDQYRQSTEPTAAHHFMEETMLGRPQRNRGLGAIAEVLFGGSKHLWMWDYRAMAHELAAAGFVEIRRAQFGDHPDPMFKLVEHPGRWSTCLGVNCLAPSA